jgi:hypothetical protein
MTRPRPSRPALSGGSAALIAGRAARAYGAAPPASRLLRIADATALRAGLDPGDLCGPSGRKPRAGQGLPPPSARPAPRSAPHARASTPRREDRDQLIPYPVDQRFPYPRARSPRLTEGGSQLHHRHQDPVRNYVTGPLGN